MMYDDESGDVHRSLEALTEEWQTIEELRAATGLGPSRLRDALVTASYEGACESDTPRGERVTLSSRWRVRQTAKDADPAD